MGTNFYWILGEATQSVETPMGDTIGIELDSDDPRFHIGKRSAAGKYCWDCDETLCPGGKSMVHAGSFRDPPWPDGCPKCGNSLDREKIDEGAAGIELGFRGPRNDRPTGIGTASSFSWAQDPDKVRQVCEHRMDEELIEDEYDRKMTCREFLRMLQANCPIEFRSIGQRFS